MPRRYTVEDLYFNWLCSFVDNPVYAPSGTYQRLLTDLHNKVFFYTIPMDANRAVDGVELRYQFGEAYGIHQSEIAHFIDNKPSSVLEVLVALAYRYEVHILSNPAIGDRTAQWFWEMLGNLGLDEMEDDCYNHEIVMETLDRFMRREYSRDGTGGGIFVTNTNQDMRQIELWYQFSIWHNEMVDEGRLQP